MDNKNFMSHVDHTLLKPFASWKDIQKLCEEAKLYKTASVCVPPCYVKRIKDEYKNEIKICTVIGFPLGYNTIETKLSETKKALEDGADEIDMVINITDVKNKEYSKVEKEIKQLKTLVKDKILKVIIETCYLEEDEKIAICKAITNAQADYIKTSTGFGTNGVVIADIELFKKYIGKDVKIKAAGGIRTIEEIETFIKAGCERIGTSSAVELLKGNSVKGY